MQRYKSKWQFKKDTVGKVGVHHPALRYRSAVMSFTFNYKFK